MISVGAVVLLIAAFIFFCLGVELFDVEEKGVRVDHIGLMFFALGVLLYPWVLPWRVLRPAPTPPG